MPFVGWSFVSESTSNTNQQGKLKTTVSLVFVSFFFYIYFETHQEIELSFTRFARFSKF